MLTTSIVTRSTIPWPDGARKAAWRIRWDRLHPDSTLRQVEAVAVRRRIIAEIQRREAMQRSKQHPPAVGFPVVADDAASRTDEKSSPLVAETR